MYDPFNDGLWMNNESPARFNSEQVSSKVNVCDCATKTTLPPTRTYIYIKKKNHYLCKANVSPQQAEISPLSF